MKAAIKHAMKEIRQAAKEREASTPVEVDILPHIAQCYWPLHEDVEAGNH